MNARRTVTTAALLVLAGCIPAYVSPTREDAANLKLVPRARSMVNVSGFVNGKECRTRLALSSRTGLKESADVRVVPDEEFTVLALLTDAGRDCKIALTFLPKPRRSYAAVIEGSSFECGMAILRAEGKAWVPERSVRKRSWSLPTLSNDQSQCGD